MALASSSAGRIFIAASPFCVKQKTPPGSSAEGVEKKNAPDRREPLLSRTNKAWPSIRGATLTSWERPHALGGMPTHPRQLTYALRCRILCGRCAAVPCTLSGPFREKRRNAASSLTNGFRPASQLRRLSVQAWFAVISASTV